MPIPVQRDGQWVPAPRCSEPCPALGVALARLEIRWFGRTVLENRRVPPARGGRLGAVTERPFARRVRPQSIRAGRALRFPRSGLRMFLQVNRRKAADSACPCGRSAPSARRAQASGDRGTDGVYYGGRPSTQQGRQPPVSRRVRRRRAPRTAGACLAIAVADNLDHRRGISRPHCATQDRELIRAGHWARQRGGTRTIGTRRDGVSASWASWEPTEPTSSERRRLGRGDRAIHCATTLTVTGSARDVHHSFSGRLSSG